MASVSLGAIRSIAILLSVGLVTASCGGSTEPFSLTGPSATDVAGDAEGSARAGAQAARPDRDRAGA